MSTPINNAALPTNPYHIARAYAQAGQRRDLAAQPPSASVAPVAAPKPAPVRKDTIDTLVAASVPGKTNFAPTAAAPRSADTLPMYRSPTDRNEVNTVLMVGRTLDTNG